jgi:hypothetical protein
MPATVPQRGGPTSGAGRAVPTNNRPGVGMGGKGMGKSNLVFGGRRHRYVIFTLLGNSTLLIFRLIGRLPRTQSRASVREFTSHTTLIQPLLAKSRDCV